jgi:SAM-dependent methyltransferase
MPYDPTLYLGGADYYAHGRPPYSRDLVPTLAAAVGLNGSGLLLDVGCGPGMLTVELAHLFDEAIGLDPDGDMLAAAARRAGQRRIGNIRWVKAVAEDIGSRNLGRFKMVTFGQSFHWTDREHVAELVYDCLEPGGTVALIGHTPEGRPQPVGPGYPPIPHEAIHTVIKRFLGPRRRAGQDFASPPSDRHEQVLARTRFGQTRSLFCRGRSDIVQDIDGVVANYLSTSFAAPHLFGVNLERFKAQLRAELAEHSPVGLFWDWPGDTEVLLVDKPQ